MPKKAKSFRFSDAANEALTTYSQKWGCNPTEALERLLLRWRYLDDVGFSEFQERLDDEISCSLRIRNKGLFYCMHGVPQNVKLTRRLIETLDICRVCRRRKLGLTEKTQMSQPVPAEKAGMEDEKEEDAPRIQAQVASPSFTTSSSPEPNTKPSQLWSCPRYKNWSWCVANPCDTRKQCRTLGKFDDQIFRRSSR